MPQPHAARPLALVSAAALVLVSAGCSADLDDDITTGEPRPDFDIADGAETVRDESPGTIIDPPRPDPVATTMASGLNAPGETFVRGEFLSWIDVTDEGAVLAGMPVDGGVPSVVAVLAEPPFDGAVHESGLYFTAPRGQELLVSNPVTGDAEAFATAAGVPLAIEVYEDHAYWSTAAGCIQRTTFDGSETVTLACGSGAPLSIAIAAERVVWSTDEGLLYSTSLEPTEKAELLASGESFAAGITTDDSRVYWANHTARDLRSVGIEGGEVETLAQRQYAVSGLTQDRFYLYFTTHSDDSIKRLWKGGGEVEVVVANQAAPSYISLDEEFLFWANEGDGTIARIAKW